MMSFHDTEVAFRDKSRGELKRAFWLFRLVGSPFLVWVGSALLRFALAIGFPVKWALKPTIFAHFCGGESIEECEATVRKLEQSNIMSILDYSAEGKESEADFEATRDQIIKTMDKAMSDSAVPYAVFKPTGLVRFAILEKLQLGVGFSDKEHKAYERFRDRLDEICAYARKTGVPVMVDAEESWIQDGVDQLVEELMMAYNTSGPLVFNTLQMYRHDRLDYLRVFYDRAAKRGVYPAFKLVRGAYMEKERARAAALGYPSPIYPDKHAADEAFDEATRFCLNHVDRVAVCIGTHNELSCIKAAAMMKDQSIQPDHRHVSFAQLLGMSDHISYKLAAAGYQVCKYVPYGPIRTVVPYLMRRAKENTSVAGQTPRELSLIRAELKRRQSGRTYLPGPPDDA